MSSKIKSIVSVVLIASMLVQVCSGFAYATENAEESVSAVNGVLSSDAISVINANNRKPVLEASNHTVLFENVARRNEYQKGYRLTDGSENVIIYPFSVNEADTNGKWVEIDNNLTESLDESGQKIYTAKSLSKETVIRDALNTQGYIEIKTPDGKISWGMSAEKENIKTILTSPENAPGYEVLQPKSVGNILTMQNVFEDMDLRLQLVGKDTEENVILNTENAARYVSDEGMTYRLKVSGYTAELKDNAVMIYAANEKNGDAYSEPSFMIEAPCMEDLEGNTSTDIKLEIIGETKENDESEYTVKITPEKEWLLSEDRVYPIVIDPTISQSTSTRVLRATTVTSVASYDPQYKCGTQHCGKDGAYYGKMRVALQFDLPEEVTESDMVINASIIARQRGYSGATGAQVTINAHKITTTASIGWSFKWATLNGHYDETVLDSQTLSNATKNKFVLWDITKAVKDWYIEGDNHGIALISENEESSYKYVGFISPYDTGVSSNNYPIISITYINQEGTESSSSYHTFGSPTMGLVSVGDFNGNLVYQFSDIAVTGANLPLSISHIYNLSKRSDNTNSPSVRYGQGFQLNLSARIEPVQGIPDYPYRLVDSDGTIHYFETADSSPNQTYKKEFESTTVLTKTIEGYILDYNSDIVYTFDNSGVLTSITDNSNNKTMTLEYKSGKLTQVTDGAGRTALLSYNSSGYLSKIQDPAGRNVVYTYSSNRLTRVTYPDGEYIGFEYSNTGDGTYKISKITDIDGLSYEIEYYQNAPCRVKSVTEKGSSGGEGRKLTWNYGSGETTVTDRNGATETMMFDIYGHTICIKDSMGNAYFGSYKNDENDNKHSLVLSSKLQGSVTNYLRQHSFEAATYEPWSEYAVNGGTGTLILATTQKYSGKKSLRIKRTEQSGDYGIEQTVEVPMIGSILGDSAYEYYDGYITLSAYVKVASISAASTSAGLVLELSYRDANGNLVTSRSTPLRSTCDWQRITHSVKIPEGAQSSITARLVLSNATGQIYIDGFQLERGPVSNRYNLIQNGHFIEPVNSDSAESWTGSNLTSGVDGIVSGHDGNGFAITGNSASEKSIKQTFNIVGNIGDSYVYGAWAKADAMSTENSSPHLSATEKRPFGIVIKFFGADGSTEEISANFESKSSNWQYLSGSAVAPFDYTKIEYYLVYSNQKNVAVFDDAQLYKEGYGDVITYDDSGRVTKVINCEGKETLYTYAFDNRSEVASITYPDGLVSTYNYDNNTHRLLSITDSNGKTADYHYDTDGNNTKVLTTVENLSLRSEENTYDSFGQVVSSTTGLGNTTQYRYNTQKGLLVSMTEPNSAVTNFTYNANNDLITGVSKAGSFVNYVYSNRKLTGIVHAASQDVNYGLSYNQFGEKTGVNVGIQNLVTYLFADNNGDLTRINYGNSTYSEPVYDSFSRKIGLKKNGTTAYRWYYGIDGLVGFEEDCVNNTTWRYTYDSEGQVSSVAGSNGEYMTNVYSSSGKVTGTSVKSGATTSTQSYSYDQTSQFLASSTFNNGALSYNYDTLDRLRSKTLTAPNGSSPLGISTYYTYRAGSESNSTTVIPSTVKAIGPNWGLGYYYRYNSMGYISSVSISHTASQGYETYAEYQYDALGRLSEEKYVTLGKKYVYSYDSGGNITSVTEKDLSDNIISSVSYGYGNSNWKDQLTSYNGSTISYDQIGNPISYRNNMSFGWDCGHELSSVTVGNSTTAYKYNSSGIRTSKTTGNTTTKYTLAGSKVVKETTGGNYILYFYDADGSPVSLRRKSGSTVSDYYYIKNTQGDIIAIADSNGNKVTEYTYNAWGSLISLIDTTTEHIGDINPFRYRGYWYDSESGLYYVNSRYYDPEVCRLISPDSVSTLFVTPTELSDKNLYAYCDNNPVSRTDGDGDFWNMICGAVIGGFIGGVKAYLNGENVVMGAARGALSGALSGLGVDAAIATGGIMGIAIASVSGGIVEVGNNIYDQITTKGSVNVAEAASCFFAGATSSMLSYCAGGGSMKKVTGGLLETMVNNFKSTLNANTMYYSGGKMVNRSFLGKLANRVANIASEFATNSLVSIYLVTELDNIEGCFE